MGDVYGSLNATFTLLALLVSVYINFIQLRQFASIEKRELMSQVRRFNDRMSDDKEILPTMLDIEQDKIIFVNDNGRYGFKNKLDGSDRDANRRAHKLLSFFEEYIICMEEGLVDVSLTSAVAHRLRRFMRCEQMKNFVNNFEDTDKSTYPGIRRAIKNKKDYLVE